MSARDTMPALRRGKPRKGERGAACFILRPAAHVKRPGLYRLGGTVIMVGDAYHKAIEHIVAAPRNKTMLHEPRTRWLHADAALAGVVHYFWPDARWMLTSAKQKLLDEKRPVTDQVFIAIQGGEVVALLAPLRLKP